VDVLKNQDGGKERCESEQNAEKLAPRAAQRDRVFIDFHHGSSYSTDPREASVSTAKTATNIAIIAALVIGLFALLELLPGIFGELGKSITDAFKKSVADGTKGAAETVSATASQAVAGAIQGMGTGLLTGGQTLADSFQSNFVPFGSKDQRTPLDEDPSHYDSYYAKIAPGAPDATPNFLSYSDPATSYALDDKGNIVNLLGQLVSYNPANL
jgi:hypothetical protein